jgi:hypothetical protein
MKVFYTQEAFLPPKTPERDEGDKTGVCVETLGTIIIYGDKSDPDNIRQDEVQYWHSMPDDMDINDTLSGEKQVPVSFPTAKKIKEMRGRLHKQKCINNRVQEGIREKYSVEEELKGLRTGDTNLKDHVLACCAKGDEEKIALGLK